MCWLSGWIHNAHLQPFKWVWEPFFSKQWGRFLKTSEVVLGRGLQAELLPNSCFEAEVYLAAVSRPSQLIIEEEIPVCWSWVWYLWWKLILLTRTDKGGLYGGLESSIHGDLRKQIGKTQANEENVFTNLTIQHLEKMLQSDKTQYDTDSTDTQILN